MYTSCHPEHQICVWGLGRQTDRQTDRLTSAPHLLDFCQLGTLSQDLAQPGHILWTHSAVPETEANKATQELNVATGRQHSLHIAEPHIPGQGPQ